MPFADAGSLRLLEGWERTTTRSRTGAREPWRGLALAESSDHRRCVAISSLFRGGLCTQLAAGPVREYAAGQSIYHMGGEARSVFLIKRGLVKTSVVSSRGQELTLRLFAAGDIMGEVCLCGGERREQAVALEASDVVEIPIERLMAKLRENPSEAAKFASMLCERMADAEERLRSQVSDSVLERLVRTLVTLCADYGEQAAGGVRISHYLAQDELASIVGARREVVSSLMNRLRAQGLVTYTRGGLIVVELDRLLELRELLRDGLTEV